MDEWQKGRVEQDLRFASGQSRTNEDIIGKGDVVARIQEGLFGKVDPRMNRGIRKLASDGLLKMDGMTEALLLHHGVNPAVAAAVAYMTRNHDVRNDAFAICNLVNLGTSLRPLVWLRTPDGSPSGCVWTMSGVKRRLVLVHVGLPETVACRLIGRSPSLILDHPVLADDRWTIESVTCHERETYMALSGVEDVDADVVRHLPAVGRRDEIVLGLHDVWNVPVGPLLRL
jgi:hypothetical protein